MTDEKIGYLDDAIVPDVVKSYKFGLGLRASVPLWELHILFLLPRYHIAIDKEKFVLTWRSTVVGKGEEGGGGDSHNGNGAGQGRPSRSTRPYARA